MTEPERIVWVFPLTVYDEHGRPITLCQAFGYGAWVWRLLAERRGR